MDFIPSKVSLWALSPKKEFLVAAIQLKELSLTELTYDEVVQRTKKAPLLPTLLAEGATIDGLENIVDYLDQRFPQAQILPPEPIRRAHMKMLVRNLAKEGTDSTTAKTLIAERKPFVLGKERSALDLLLAPFSKDPEYVNLIGVH